MARGGGGGGTHFHVKQPPLMLFTTRSVGVSHTMALPKILHDLGSLATPPKCDSALQCISAHSGTPGIVSLRPKRAFTEPIKEGGFGLGPRGTAPPERGVGPETLDAPDAATYSDGSSGSSLGRLGMLSPDERDESSGGVSERGW